LATQALNTPATGIMPVFSHLMKLPNAMAFSPWKAKSGAAVAEGRLGGEKLLLAKPQSFMNKSGGPVGEISRFFKIPPAQVFVFYDEIDLVAGKVRVKRGGGHGGHNGIRDIDRHLGSDYWRVRIGVGRPEQVIPGSRIDIRKWVLMDFSSRGTQRLVACRHESHGRRGQQAGSE
jgi:PTH1 family peptidyl-tRNA hydrolase